MRAFLRSLLDTLVLVGIAVLVGSGIVMLFLTYPEHVPAILLIAAILFVAYQGKGRYE